MKIIKTVAVKQILTQSSKQQRLDKIKKDILHLRKECEQLRFEMRRQERERKYDKGMLRKKFEREIDHRQEKCKLLEYQMEQLEALPLGSEISDGDVEMLLDIDIGDDWEQVMNQPTIIIKNGKIHDIRW